MNAQILSDAQLILQWNEQNAIACARTKTTLEWDFLEETT
jgi:hypothetical protein